MDQITKDIFALQETFLKIAQEAHKRGFMKGLENCGHDFLENADKAYQIEKDKLAVDGIKSK